MNYELESMWNEKALASFKVQCWHLSEVLRKTNL